MSAPVPQVTTAAIDVLYDYLWEPDDATSREECAEVIVEILKASDVVSADTLRALITEWRRRVDDRLELAAASRDADQYDGFVSGMTTCADELERAMRGGKP